MQNMGIQLLQPSVSGQPGSEMPVSSSDERENDSVQTVFENLFAQLQGHIESDDAKKEDSVTLKGRKKTNPESEAALMAEGPFMQVNPENQAGMAGLLKKGGAAGEGLQLQQESPVSKAKKSKLSAMLQKNEGVFKTAEMQADGQTEKNKLQSGMLASAVLKKSKSAAAAGVTETANTTTAEKTTVMQAEGKASSGADPNPGMIASAVFGKGTVQAEEKAVLDFKVKQNISGQKSLKNEKNAQASETVLSVKTDGNRPDGQTESPDVQRGSRLQVNKFQTETGTGGQQNGEGNEKSADTAGKINLQIDNQSSESVFKGQIVSAAEQGHGEIGRSEGAQETLIQRMTSVNQAGFSSERTGETPVLREPVAEQVVPVMARMIRGQQSKLTLSLKPAELGTLKIELNSQQGVVGAKFLVENQEVRQMVEASLPELKSMMERQGIQVESVNVEVRADADGGSQSSQTRFARQQQGNGSGTPSHSQHDGRNDEEEADPRQQSRQYGYNSMEFVA